MRGKLERHKLFFEEFQLSGRTASRVYEREPLAMLFHEYSFS